MIPPDTNVIVRYGKPIDNSIDPTMAPKKFAILKIEAASVLASNGASCALKITLLFNRGVVPKVPKPNKKHIIIAKIALCTAVTNKTIVIKSNKKV